MTKQITLEEALDLVSFCYGGDSGWQVRSVFSDVGGNVHGSVGGDVAGDVHGNVFGNCQKHVFGNVGGKINGHEWDFVETPKDKLQRLITESGNQELIDTFNQMENN